MNILFVFLAFVSGLIVFKYPLFLLLYVLLMYKLWRVKLMRYVALGFFMSGVLIMAVLHFYLRLPFTNGLAVVIKVSDNSFLISQFGRRYFVSAKDHPYNVFDVVRIEGSTTNYFFGTLEGEFNYNAYLASKGVFKRVEIETIRVVIKSPLTFINDVTTRLPAYPPPFEPIRRLLLFKDVDNTDTFTKELRHQDLFFLINLSGVHLSLLRRTYKKGLGLFISDTTSELFSYLLLIPLFLLNITKFAFYRIFASGLCRYINKKKLASYFTTLEINVLLAFIFLLINPFLIFDPAYYLAFTLIILFNLFRPTKSLTGKVLSLIVVYVVIIPYKIITNGVINITGLFLPIILTPLVSTWFILYFITIPLPFLHNSPLTILHVIYQIMQFANTFTLLLYFKKQALIVGPLIVTILTMFFYALSTKNRFILKILSSGGFLAFLISFVPITNYLMYKVTFLNVGQGDSILIESRGTNVLIDTGGLRYKDIGSDILIPYFLKHNIYKLDYLITTHDDFDHNGAAPTLLRDFRISTYITERQMFPLITRYTTFYNLNNSHYGDDNLDSLIIYFTLPFASFLLMGDASILNEEVLIQEYPTLHVDVLKVGHHGSHTSTSVAFIQHYTPKVAIISAGYDNYYGHPHESVLATLRKHNVIIRRTDLEGTIVLKSSII